MDKRLLERALETLARLRPLPNNLARQLDLETLRRLLLLLQRMRAQGLGGPSYRPPERLELMRRLLREQGPKPEDPVEQMEPSSRRRQKAAESLARKADQASEMAELKRGR
jgi:cytochrome c-type biogenesis protein CcmH/NrfG